MSVENISDVYRRLTKKEADQTQVRNYLSKSELNNGTMPFDRFLTVMAELDGCDMCTSDGTVSSPHFTSAPRDGSSSSFLRRRQTSNYAPTLDWTCALLKMRHFIREFCDLGTITSSEPLPCLFIIIIIIICPGLML